MFRIGRRQRGCHTRDNMFNRSPVAGRIGEDGPAVVAHSSGAGIVHARLIQTECSTHPSYTLVAVAEIATVVVTPCQVTAHSHFILMHYIV